MYNATNRKDIRKAEKVAEVENQRRINFIVAAMSTAEGRIWFHDLLSRCHIFADPFTGDALLEAYSKGERNVGLQIYSDIVTHCPDYFVTMMKEASIRELTNARRSESADESDTDEPIGDAYDPYSESADSRERSDSEESVR